MIASTQITGSSTLATRPDSFGRFSSWTNKVLTGLLQNYNDEHSSEARAKAKLMSFMSASLRTQEGIQSASAKFANGMLRELELETSHISTSQKVQAFNTAEAAEIAREAIISQLSNHVLAPSSYEIEDGAFVIDFSSSPSRLTCVFDEYGLQLMWRGPTGITSETTRKDALNASQVLQKIAVILFVS